MPISFEFLCNRCVKEIRDIVTLDYIKSTFIVSCTLCGAFRCSDNDVAEYRLSTEDSPSFVPVQGIKCVNCGETGQPHRAYDKLCKLCGDLWPTGQMYTRSEFYK